MINGMTGKRRGIRFGKSSLETATTGLNGHENQSTQSMIKLYTTVKLYQVNIHFHSNVKEPPKRPAMTCNHKPKQTSRSNPHTFHHKKVSLSHNTGHLMPAKPSTSAAAYPPPRPSVPPPRAQHPPASPHSTADSARCPRRRPISQAVHAQHLPEPAQT